MATSGGEANDEEDVPGGNNPGGETYVGDDEVDFTDVPQPTTVIVGGSDFVLTADGRYVITLRSEWYGGGDAETELRSRRLLAIDTQVGEVVGELDVRDAGKLGLVLLADARRFVLVRRDAEGFVNGLETVLLPAMLVESAYAPRTKGNMVRLSPSGRHAALWTVSQPGWPSWNLYLSVENQVVGIEDLQSGGPPRELTASWGVADVISAPDGSAMYVALSTRDYNLEPVDYHLEVVRVSLVSGLPTASLLLPLAGHAADNEIKGGSALRLSPDGHTLTFSGCSFETGTCNARWYVMNAANMILRGDLRAAGASAFTPDGGRAIGWDGQSSEEGKIWVEDCIFSDEQSDLTDHWLVDVNLQTLETTPIDLPKLAPYYFVTRDGAYAVASVENCSEEELWVVDLATGAASAVEYADHGLHQFTVMEDDRTIYSVDEGMLERIDLAEREILPLGYQVYATRINRVPGSERLVLGGSDLMVFTLLDAATGDTEWRLDLLHIPAPPPPSEGGAFAPAPMPHMASTVPGLVLLREPVNARVLRHGPRELRPRQAGGLPGVELKL